MTTETQVRPLTEDEIKAQMTQAVANGDWSAVKKLAAELDKIAKAEAAKAKAELQTKLVALGNTVKGLMGTIVVFLTQGSPASSDDIKRYVSKLRELKGTELDGADGVWYANEFGTLPTGESIRLMKGEARKAGTGGGASKSSYITDPRKSSDLLAIVGEQIMFEKDTTVTIDKAEHVIPAGTTLRQAYDYSTNGGWRNRVRMAILKAANATGA